MSALLKAVWAAVLLLFCSTVAAAKDWSSTVTVAPGGAYVLGNPKAKVKLIEYISMTCSHCADFNRTGVVGLKKNYIAKGLVSLEVRHALRDPFDFAAALLARCTGPQGYFSASAKILAMQEQWMARGDTWQRAHADELAKMDRDAVLVALSNGAGLPAYTGATPEKARACLSNRAEQQLLAKMTGEAWDQRKIGGTPSFVLDGKLLDDTTNWPALEPQIRKAVQ